MDNPFDIEEGCILAYKFLRLELICKSFLQKFFLPFESSKKRSR